MNHHSSTIKKYYPALVGAALIAASLFQFSRPVFSAGTEAGQKIRNTATGTYKDDADNDYTIDSNTVEVTVAKVAGITNIPTGISDINGGTVLTGDEVSFEFTITNVGNDISDIYIPDIKKLVTKGLKLDSNLILAIKGIDGSDSYSTSGTTFIDKSNADPAATQTPVTVKNVPINGQIVVSVTGIVEATAAGAAIEVRLGNTGSNSSPNKPAADTQNQPDNQDYVGGAADPTNQEQDVRTKIGTAPSVAGEPVSGHKEASAVGQVFLGSNPLAMTRIEKTREIDAALGENTDTALNNNIITYKLGLEVLTTTPNSLYTPGKLEGRDFTGRMPASITDPTNLVLVSDAIPVGTHLNSFPTSVTDTDGREWTPVYSVSPEPSAVTNKNKAADNIEWKAGADVTNLTDVTRVGWVYDASNGAIEPGDVVAPEFSFDVITDGLTASGGTVANIAQVFGSTDDGVATTVGEKIFDESGDQDPSNFSGANPGPSETATGSTGIANPVGHGVDKDNNNNATGSVPASPGGEDNVITISEAGKLLNGPHLQPAATGNVFNRNPEDNNHDFQNLGIENFESAECTDATNDRPQQDKGCKLNPDAVVFDNTLSNPAVSLPNGINDLKNVLIQPINPKFGGIGDTDANLPNGTKVTIKLGTQQAIYTYTLTGTGTSAVGSFSLDPNTTANPSQPIKIPTLAAGVPLNYKVTVDLPANTLLSTDVGHGYAVPIIAFIDGNNNGTPDSGENSNYTVNQVYTDFIKITKQVQVLDPDGEVRDNMDYGDDDADKQPLPGDTLVYRVNYRNISEPQAGNGNNLILNGKAVLIDENGTKDGNNWGLDNNDDDDLDTINVRNTAKDSNGKDSEITYYTGIDGTTSAGINDPGDAVTGYSSTIDTLAPSADDSTFEFQRKVDEYDGLAEEGLP
jgi:hypothetical protein